MKTVAAIRALLGRRRRECEDVDCPGWDVFEAGRGLEIQRCDACCPDELGDDDVARLPEAKLALRVAIRTGPVEEAIERAAWHGRVSDPDHEVGDLQLLVRIIAKRVDPRMLEAAVREWSTWVGPAPGNSGSRDGN
jgi:hypothetical protein